MVKILDKEAQDKIKAYVRFVSPRKSELPSVFCPIESYNYNFVKKEMVVCFEENTCCDMTMMIEYALKIDPEVEIIQTVSGQTLDLCYIKTPNGWGAAGDYAY